MSGRVIECKLCARSSAGLSPDKVFSDKWLYVFEIKHAVNLGKKHGLI